jgi:beta-glucanase (GH16 family)
MRLIVQSLFIATALVGNVVAQATETAASPNVSAPADPRLTGSTGTSYHLTFDDEFNAYNQARWQTADFWGMRNNGGDFQGQWFADPELAPKDSGQQPYNPFSARDGVLRISAQPTPKGIYSGPGNHPYVSGQLTSAHKFTQRYGYFELRAKLPPGKGLWSRFWLLTDDGIWPGEYDIFEILGRDPGEIHQTTHFRDVQRAHAAYGTSYKGINPTDGQFHTYGFLWEKTGVTWFVDGVATLQQINRIDVPMYVLIDLVVGNDPGNLWPGNPDATNQWPAVMELDYYRVYSNDPSLPTVVPDAGYTPSVLPYGFTVETTSPDSSLPPGWTAGDIGKPELKGSSTWNRDHGEWLLKGAGYGKQGQFASISHTGDGMITATATSVSIINSNDLQAGIAFRDGRAPNAPEVSLAYVVSYNSPKISHSIVFQSRTSGASKELGRATNTDAPATLRLTREGNTFSGSYSADGGRTWIPVGTPQVVEIPETVEVGLIVGGNQNNYLRLSRAYFQAVSVEAIHH